MINAVKSKMDIRKLSSESKRGSGKSGEPSDNKSEYNVKMTNVTYSVATVASDGQGALVDRGANGGIAGNTLRIISQSDRSVDINGIDNHQMKNLRVVTAGGVIETQRGPTIAIFY